MTNFIVRVCVCVCARVCMLVWRQEETKTCKQVVLSEYAKMHQFLKEEEQLQLQLLEMEERENLKKLRDNEIRLTQQMRSLSKMMEQIESTCQNSIIESFEVRTLEKRMKKKTLMSSIIFQVAQNKVFFIYLKN